MRRFISVLAAAALTAGGAASEPAGPVPGQQAYCVGFLRPNPARKPIEQAERERIMAAHMANIRKMAADGVLAAAGPMQDKPTAISGIFIFRTSSLAQARRIAALDPTVVEGRNTVDVHPWMGPEGIGANYFQWKKENPEGKDVMAAHAFCILLKRGTALPADPHAEEEHAAFIEMLRSSGALAAAGQVDEDPEIAGIVIFKSDSIEDARRSIDRDPSVASGRLLAQFHRWWCADRVLPW